MFGILALMGDLGCSIGPWLAGFVSDFTQRSSTMLKISTNKGLSPEQFGLKTGILVAIIFPLIMFIGVLLLKNDDM